MTASHRGDILVVDDTPASVWVLSAVLKGRGHRVRTVTSGALALEAMVRAPPDLVVLDACMPGIDGYEVCRRVKAHEALRGIPVVFASALSETFDQVKAFSAGAVDYVTKPFRVEEILARVETHLAVRALQVELERKHRELQASHARLQALERGRQRLVEMVVHDLKNPVAAIQSTAEYLRHGAALQGDAADALQLIQDATASLEAMVLNVLDFARAEDARLRPALARTDVAHLVAEVAAQAQGRGRAHGREIAAEVAPDLQAPLADAALLRRVLENLVDNALKYAPRGTAVRVGARPAGAGRWALTVADAGPGVPAAQREAIFDAYARLDRDATAHARTSRGLGLAFCRAAVEAHGGRIWVEEGRPRGSVFVAELPLDGAARAGAVPQPDGLCEAGAGV